MKRGIGAIGAIIIIVLIAVVIYLVWNFGEIWFTNKWLTGKVRDAIQTRFMEGEQSVTGEIVRSAMERNIVLNRDLIVIQRPHGDSMRVALEYDDEIQMPGFNRTYHLKVDITEGVGGS